MVQWHICMVSICIFMVQWHKGRASIDAMVHYMAQRSKLSTRCICFYMVVYSFQCMMSIWLWPSWLIGRFPCCKSQRGCITYLALWDLACLNYEMEQPLVITFTIWPLVIWLVWSLSICILVVLCPHVLALYCLCIKKIPLIKSLDPCYGYCENDQVCIKVHNVFCVKYYSSVAKHGSRTRKHNLHGLMC